MALFCFKNTEIKKGNDHQGSLKHVVNRLWIAQFNVHSTMVHLQRSTKDFVQRTDYNR